MEHLGVDVRIILIWISRKAHEDVDWIQWRALVNRAMKCRGI
jgi:hypothetical protein